MNARREATAEVASQRCLSSPSSVDPRQGGLGGYLGGNSLGRLFMGTLKGKGPLKGALKGKGGLLRGRWPQSGLLGGTLTGGLFRGALKVSC